MFRLDREGVLARLRVPAQALVTGHADVIVVVRDDARSFLDRIPRFAAAFTGIGIGCDLIV